MDCVGVTHRISPQLRRLRLQAEIFHGQQVSQLVSRQDYRSSSRDRRGIPDQSHSRCRYSRGGTVHSGAGRRSHSEDGTLQRRSGRFLAGTLGELASMALWVLTNLIVYPNALVPYAFQTAFAIVTAVSAVLALSGGIIGGAVSLQHWPRIHALLMGWRIGFPLHLHHSAQMRVEKNKED